MKIESRYDETRVQLALDLLDAGAILTSESKHPLVVERAGEYGKERGFLLKLHEKNPEAPLSPFKLLLHTPEHPIPGPLTEQLIELSARCMHGLQYWRKLQFDAIVPLPRAGDPFGYALARITGRECLPMTKEEKQGKRRVTSLVKTPPRSVRRVLVVDDLITQADTKMEAINVLRAHGLEVADVLVLVDREQGGRQKLEEWDCRLHSVFTVRELFNLCSDTGRLSEKLEIEIEAYLAREAA